MTMQNHFELFHLPVSFAIDMAQLAKSYHEVQGQVHPDRFARASETEKRVAMQWATRANEAYQTLRDPFKRAAYLCELHGVDLQTESNTAMPAAFLMQQMEWREALDDARAAADESALEDLLEDVESRTRQQLTQLESLFSSQDYVAAAQVVRQMMFLEKFGDELRNAIDRLAD